MDDVTKLLTSLVLSIQT